MSFIREERFFELIYNKNVLFETEVQKYIQTPSKKEKKWTLYCYVTFWDTLFNAMSVSELAATNTPSSSGSGIVPLSWTITFTPYPFVKPGINSFVCK